jgi:Co/Zn/Cd efflux system component
MVGTSGLGIGMKRTEYKVPKMDCPSEEQLIRMKLKPAAEVRRLQFDIPARKLGVFHTGDGKEIRSLLEQLNLGAVEVTHEDMGTPDGDHKSKEEKGPLIAAFSINAVLFIAEFAAGLVAYSLGLIGDSLDMLADAIVYGMALAAVGGSAGKKLSIAHLTGYFQGFLAVTGLAEVVRRAIGGEGIPDFRIMIVLSCIALIGNAATLLILNRSKGAGVHMKAAWICTAVDVQVNALVIASGAAVYFTASRIPDLIVGGIIFLLVANGSRKILKLA